MLPANPRLILIEFSLRTLGSGPGPFTDAVSGPTVPCAWHAAAGAIILYLLLVMRVTYSVCLWDQDFIRMIGTSRRIAESPAVHKIRDWPYGHSMHAELLTSRLAAHGS